jgi:hypothetical protein
MTLILTVGNPRGVHQSSDYQLTNQDTGTPDSDRAGSKQLEAVFERLQLQLAFTGVATVETGPSAQRTIDWLSNELKALPRDCDLDKICDALSKRCAAKMRPLGSRAVLTLILTVAVIGEPFRVVTITNVDWRQRPPRAMSQFKTGTHTIGKPYVLISGYRACVPLREVNRLKALARTAGNKSPKEIIDELSAINVIAARDSGGYVSEECWVTSQVTDGRARRSATRNVGEQGGSIPSVQAGMDLTDWVMKNLRAAPGKEIRLVQGASVIVGPGDLVPVPPPEGKPWTFKLTGSSTTTQLRSPSGKRCASIEITQLNCEITVKRNEQVTVPFARIHLSGIQSCPDFSKPLFPWPQITPNLTVDGTPIDRGWEYAIVHWVEGGILHVEIPQASRGVRNLAFLGDDDELVIAVGISELPVAWSLESGPTATLPANIWWRTRLDGTRG